jgi:hypothetical protein
MSQIQATDFILVNTEEELFMHKLKWVLRFKIEIRLKM